MNAGVPVMRVHCGVAFLDMQLPPAGRDWVLLVTFSRAIELERKVR